ncbi:MAG TPA: N-6 DNA methylase [Solirubrobacteraceae bacterium]|jgi:hypothetical protein
MKLSTLETAKAANTSGHDQTSRKRHGVHYTPSDLAEFVARRALGRLKPREFVVLDPACGNGELLLAFANGAAKAKFPAPRLIGIDTDKEAITAARKRLAKAPASSVTLRCEDFLTRGTDDTDPASGPYDVIISNPPYVRTQVLGTERAQALAYQFGLTGRVDLYHAFVAAMTAKLQMGGILGLLCSNRFLTTRGGQSLRSLLIANYDLEELWDLGDTKLFGAAVLPAVLIAQRGDARGGDRSFVRVYEDQDGSTPATAKVSLLAGLENGLEGIVKANGRRFNIERGRLLDETPKRPWRLTSAEGWKWLAKVRRHSTGQLGDLGPIRVGIKTTADSVFIRASWSDLPERLRPEEDLLRPLLTHRVAGRWRAKENSADTWSVLYPHESVDGRRQAVDLTHFPRAAAYLEQHRTRLEERDYIRKAGRAWYEIWVPQQPEAWAARKLVWPDISDRPRFFIDLTGAVVNGDCYWLSCPNASDEEVALAVAVANSSFALRYYDMCCGNRLYAGRRRFITQYLQELPMPAASSTQLREIVAMVDQLQRTKEPEMSPACSEAEVALDAIVSELFGIKETPRKS